MNDDTPKPLADLVTPGTTLMVAIAKSDASLEFRPLTAARIDGSLIEILLDTTEAWTRAFGEGATAYATVSDSRSNTWLSLQGTVTTTTDPEAIDELWNPAAAAYFDEGRETPGITVLRLDADDGHYWSAPSGRIGSLISMVKAKLGSPEDSGEAGDIAL